jgi:peptidyl-prolyl cis-trans isomerase SurA
MPGIKLNRLTSRNWLAGAAVAASLIAPAMAPTAALAQVVVVANGSPITELDIFQRTKLIATANHKPPTRDEVIKELIDDRLKISKARSYGLDPTQEQIDTAFEGMAKRQHISVAQFTQVLERSGISPQALKARIRAEMTWSELIRGKFGSSLQVNEGDLANLMRSRNEAENTVGYIYTLYPVTVVIPTGSNAGLVEAKRREAEALRERFTACKSGLALARAQRDVAVREPITRSSADLPEALRDLLAKLEIGRLSTPDVTAQGLQMFALCGKRESAQDSPLKRELRDQLFSKRLQAESTKFLEELRKSAMIEYK